MKKTKNIFITMLTVAIPLIVQLFYIRYVSYNVDKTIYGNFILLQTLIVALSYIFLQIPSSAYTRFYNETKDKVNFVNEFRSLLIFINLLSLIVIIIYGYIIGKFSVLVLVVTFLYFVLLNNYTFNQQIFLLNLKRKKYFLLSLFESFAKFFFPICSYYIYETLESFIFGLLLGYGTAFIYLVLNLKEYPFRFSINYNNLKKYFIYAYPTLFIGVFSWGITFSDRYFIEYFMQTKDVAVYSILAQVAGFGSIIGQIYGMYVNPIVLQEYEKDKIKTFELLGTYNKYLILVFIVVIFLAYILPLDFFTILIKKDLIYNNYNIFIILVISILLAVLQNAYAMYFVLAKKLHIITYIYVIAFIVNIVGNFYINDYGIIAAAISTLIAYIIINVLQYIYIVKNIKNCVN